MTTKELLESYYKGFAQKNNWASVLSDDFKFIGGDMTKTTPLMAKHHISKLLRNSLSYLLICG